MNRRHPAEGVDKVPCRGGKCPVTFLKVNRESIPIAFDFTQAGSREEFDPLVAKGLHDDLGRLR